MSIREAAQHATPREQLLKELMDSRVPKTEREHAAVREIETLRAALADTQDWDEIEALRASLREHMAEILRLRTAGRQALGALQFCLPLIEDYGDEEQLAIHHKDLAALTEYAMQRLTDEQQMIERGTKAWAGVPDATAWVEELRGNEPVTNCHEKEGDKLPPSLDVPETNFGNMAQAVDSTEADHVPDATKMMASVREDRTVEPVAYVTGYFEGRCVIKPFDSMLLPVGMALYRSPPTSQESRQVEPVAWMVYTLDGKSAFVTDNPADFTPGHRALPLYTAPPKRKPLTEQQIMEIEKRVHFHESLDWPIRFARELERAHGIGGGE